MIEPGILLNGLWKTYVDSKMKIQRDQVSKQKSEELIRTHMKVSAKMQ